MSKKNKTEFKENSFVDIPLDLLVPADWNYKTDDEYRQEKLKNNIKRNGQVENIIVRLLSTGFYEIVNGNHRYQALKELGNFPNVHCYNMGVISDSKAKRIAIETNETRFDTDNIKLAQTIKDLQEEFSFEELENTMPYTLDELNNFDNLLSFSSFNNELNNENIKENNQDLNEESKAGNLIKKFIIPPFSVLDTRQGYWQDRKKQWLSLGIKSELGRDNVQNSLGSAFKLKVIASSNQKLSKENIEVPNWAVTSIFDPVICELMYKWFNIENGSILDPFSGGSVRGVVASFLGYDYYGIDLRKEQIYENIKQFEELKNNFINFQDSNISEIPDEVEITISSKMANLKFNGCDMDYINNVCHASCCESKSKNSDGTIISIHHSEIESIVNRGGIVENGLLKNKNNVGKCFFKDENNLCKLHFTPDKPFGCIASPFTLNNNKTLIVRNRYKLLKCYNDGKKIPAYEAFRQSLDLILGKEQSNNIVNHFKNGGSDIKVNITKSNYLKLIENDKTKKDIKENKTNDSIDNFFIYTPKWEIGNSINLDNIYSDKMFDFIFSCPPYFDLEVYSDNPEDLSTMDWETFSIEYTLIINKAVKQLKEDRFACFVVGDVRDKKGFYYNFIDLTKKAFIESGALFYNELILVNVAGTLPVRVGKSFGGYRKVGKMHQNILVFYKGNPKNIPKNFNEIVLNQLNLEENNEID